MGFGHSSVIGGPHFSFLSKGGVLRDLTQIRIAVFSDECMKISIRNLFLVGICGFLSMQPILPQPEKRDDPKLVWLDPAETPLFSWVKAGRLYYLDFGRGVDDGILYHNRNGSLSLISRDRNALAKMVRDEIELPANIKLFLRNKFRHVSINVFASPRSYLIDTSYLEQRRFVPMVLWRDTEVGNLEQSMVLLNRYINNSDVHIMESTWRCEFHVTLSNGSIEKWAFRGKLEPFSIDVFDRTTAEREGSIIPIPEMGLTQR
jgi:hypothetical protein